MDVEQLIEFVRENRALYDANDKNHRNRDYISCVWRSIGTNLGMSEESTKAKWHQLRSNYMRVKRNSKTKCPGSGRSTSTKWPFFEMLTFLDSYVESRTASDYTPNTSQDIYENHDNLDSSQNETAAELRKEETIIYPTVKVLYSSPETSSEQPASSPKLQLKRKCFKRKSDQTDKQHLQEFKKDISTTIDENDPDRLFLLSLLPSLKQLSPADNLDFKIQMQQVLKSKLFPTHKCQCKTEP